MLFKLILITIIFIILLMIIGTVSVLGWMISDERYKKEISENKKKTQEIDTLKQKIRKLNGQLTINTATRYSEQIKEDKNEQ